MSWTCFVGGKTGGHILPGITLSCADKQQGKKIIFITTTAALDMHIMQNYPHIDVHKTVALGSSTYTGIRGILRAVFHLITTVITSILVLRQYKPERVVSTGGLVSLPVCYVAWLLRIPVIIYELNATPGRATRALEPCATELRTCFAEAKNYFKDGVFAEYPIRFTERDRMSKKESRSMLGLHEDSWTLFISGGSQGSRFINNFIMQLLSNTHAIQVIHQAGVHDVALLTEWYKNNGIRAIVFSYRPDISLCYSAADRIIARAGAGSLFEVLFFRAPALIIPLITKATDHQSDNAYAMRDRYPTLFMVSAQDELHIQRKSIEKFLLH